MNNEPVAWITPPENVWTSCLACGQRVTGDSIHTCSPQLKTLTISDRDILKIVHDKFTKFGFEADYIVEDTELIDFARAILRKAQEK
jgi:hypothetical protein